MHDKSLTAKIKVQKVKPKLNKEPENRAQKLTWTDSLTIASRRPWAIESGCGRSWAITGDRPWAIVSAHNRPRAIATVGDCERSQSPTSDCDRGRL